MLRFALPFALLAAPVYAAPVHAPVHHAAPVPKVPDTAWVAINTELGPITLELDGKHAPISTGNFLHYVDTRRFDGIIFYRSMHLDWGEQPNGLIQAGLRGDPRKVFAPVAHEPTTATGLSHIAGAISLARLAPGTATGDFSIMVSKLDGLDADPNGKDAEARAGYAVFGHVVAGMDVVRAIWDRPRDPAKGEGAMKGQLLARPVRVISLRRVPQPAP